MNTEEAYLQELAAYALEQVENDLLDLRYVDAGFLFDLFAAAKLHKLRFLTPHKKHLLEDIKAGFYGPRHIEKCKELISKLPQADVSRMTVISRHLHHLRTIINAPDDELWRLNSSLIETLHEFLNGRNTFYVYDTKRPRGRNYSARTGFDGNYKK